MTHLSHLEVSMVRSYTNFTSTSVPPSPFPRLNPAALRRFTNPPADFGSTLVRPEPKETKRQGFGTTIPLGQPLLASLALGHSSKSLLTRGQYSNSHHTTHTSLKIIQKLLPLHFHTQISIFISFLSQFWHGFAKVLEWRKMARGMAIFIAKGDGGEECSPYDMWWLVHHMLKEP